MAQHRNTYLKCNQLKFSLKLCALRSHSEPQANRKRFNSPYSRVIGASRWNNKVFEKTKVVNPPPPTATTHSPSRNSALQVLKCLSFSLIARPHDGDQRSTAGTAKAWPREISMVFLGCFFFLSFFVGLHGRRCEIHFCFGS